MVIASTRPDALVAVQSESLGRCWGNQMRGNTLTRVKAILREQWDPIGIKDEPAAQDEYDSYAIEIDRMLKVRPTTAGIAQRLQTIETELMGLEPNRERVQRVAITLLGLVEF